MRKRILISVGGTGGHLYPAQALASQLLSAHSSLDLLFVGNGLHHNSHLNRDQFSYKDVSSGTLSSNPITFCKSAGRIAKGTWKCAQIIKEYKPDLVIGFGSYHSLPLLLAARMKKIAFILHEANAIPGKVNRLLASSALFTAVHFPQAASQLKGKTILAKMPLKHTFKNRSSSDRAKEEARLHYRLDANLPTILIFGGSQGAKGINHLFQNAVTNYLKKHIVTYQVIHLTGSDKETKNLVQIYEKAHIPACVKNYEANMHLAWLAADVVVGRSGASTIAEMIEFEVPGILIPYPFAADNHQYANGYFMSEVVGGALLYLEKDISSLLLADGIRSLLIHNQALINKMREAIRLYKKQEQTQEFSTLIIELLNR